MIKRDFIRGIANYDRGFNTDKKFKRIFLIHPSSTVTSLASQSEHTNKIFKNASKKPSNS